MRPPTPIAAILLALVMPIAVTAQVAGTADPGTPPAPVWLNAGLAIDAEGDFLGFGAAVAVPHREHRLVTGRIAYLEEFQLCLFGPCSTEPEKRIEAGLLYGLAGQSGWLFAAGSAGLGFYGGRRTIGEREQENFATIGVPAEIQLYLRPSSIFGFGVTGIANLNGVDALAGVLVGVQIGRFHRATLSGRR